MRSFAGRPLAIPKGAPKRPQGALRHMEIAAQSGDNSLEAPLVGSVHVIPVNGFAQTAQNSAQMTK